MRRVGSAFLLLIGCSPVENRTEEERAPRFAVVLRISAAASDAANEGMVCTEDNRPVQDASEDKETSSSQHWLQLYEPDRLQQHLRQELEKVSMFTHVTAGTSPPGGDVVLSVKWTNLQEKEYPFGQGENLTYESFLSTLAWLTIGYGSWWVDNRVFPAEMEDGPTLVCRVAEHRALANFEEFTIPLREMELSLIDRHDWRLAIFWTLVLPPWTPPSIIEPDTELLTESLAEKALDMVSKKLAEWLRDDFGTWYARNVGTVLLLPEGKAAAENAIIASREEIASVQEYNPFAETQVSESDEPLVEYLGKDRNLVVKKNAEMEEALRRFAPRLTKKELDSYRYWYRLRLSGLRGVRIGYGPNFAYLLISGLGGELCRWTIVPPG